MRDDPRPSEALCPPDGAPGGPAPRFDDPWMDAFSVAATAAGVTPRAPIATTDDDRPLQEAAADASGAMTVPRTLARRWWTGRTGPMVVQGDDGPCAVVPAPRPTAVRQGTREPEALGRNSAAASARQGLEVLADPPAGASWVGLVRWSLGRRGGMLTAIVLMALAGGLAGLVLPVATGVIFGDAVPRGDTGRVVAILAVLLLVTVAAGALYLARNLIVVRLRDESDATLSAAVMSRALRLPVPFFRSRSEGDVVNRLMAVEQARAQVDDTVPGIVLTAAFGLTSLVYLVTLGAWVFVGVLTTTLAVVALSAWLQLRSRSTLDAIVARRSDADGMLMSMLAAAGTLRVSGAEERALTRWANAEGRALTALRLRLRRLAASEAVDAVAPVAVVTVFVALTGAEGGTFSASAFMASYTAILQVAASLVLLSASVVSLSEAGPALTRMTEITSAAPEQSGTMADPGEISGRVALEGVVFGYAPDRPPLFDGVSLAVDPGSFLAVVGPSGGGKSTIMRLLLGFERPWRGAVTYDGLDLAELDVRAVRRQMGTVLQATVPFGRTVRECVCGPRTIADDDLWVILGESGLDRDVRAMGGLDAPVQVAGSNLSGGQRQRLMIARALAGSPRVLLFDEATSALDNVTQRIVTDSLLARPVTRVVIAHRLSTIERADRVVVVAGGEVVEDGAPHELRRAGGHFSALAARQER